MLRHCRRLSTLSSPWRSLGLRSELVDAVAAQGLAAPSPIQQLAIPRLLAGASVAMASSTGSGKTLAYLVPMMQRLKEQEDARPEHKAELRPRALVLAPTRDLVEQIAAQAKALSHVCRVRVRALAAGGRLRDQRKSLRTGADLIVATPGRLLTLHKLGDVALRSVESVTVDEETERRSRLRMGGRDRAWTGWPWAHRQTTCCCAASTRSSTPSCGAAARRDAALATRRPPPPSAPPSPRQSLLLRLERALSPHRDSGRGRRGGRRRRPGWACASRAGERDAVGRGAAARAAVRDGDQCPW